MLRTRPVAVLLGFALVLSSGCQPLAPATPPTPAGAATQPGPQPPPCGDGICQPREDAHNCPADCPPAQTQKAAGGPSTAVEAPATPQAPEPQPPQAGKPVVYLSIMIHLEGWEDAADEGVFERHVEHVRSYASLFETHGARLTLESKEVTDGVLAWGDNVLLEMEQRGHGIGVHADVGGQKSYDCSQMAGDLRLLREMLESLGVRVRHVSGIVSHCDWVAAVEQAGFRFVTGVVGYGAMSMPMNLRPAEYRDCKNPAACHGVIPLELEGRIHAWRPASGDNWLEHDPRAGLVLLPSSSGLSCMHESANDLPTGDCLFTTNDIDEYLAQLDQVIAMADGRQVNLFYVSWSLGAALDETLLDAWLTRIDPYVRAGQVEWKTLPEVYDAYVAWEQGR